MGRASPGAPWLWALLLSALPREALGWGVLATVVDHLPGPLHRWFGAEAAAPSYGAVQTMAPLTPLVLSREDGPQPQRQSLVQIGAVPVARTAPQARSQYLRGSALEPLDIRPLGAPERAPRKPAASGVRHAAAARGSPAAAALALLQRDVQGRRSRASLLAPAARPGAGVSHPQKLRARARAAAANAQASDVADT
ncbi:unnamed protein product [Prorocentrum cordatum]|uniref:Uncharacterized protein n=1 Tax=Prorocentrum cordatum TaxID=2364126 RepID=A0ABN9T9U9_9DINO|nr:unnamed protein product [Polarella glacialis]